MPKTHKNGHTTVEFRSFKNFNETAFLHDVSLIDFQPMYCANDPDEAFGYLFDSLLPIIDAHAPKKLKRVKNKNLPPWLTKNIVSEMALRDQCKSQKHFELYKKQRNKVTQLIRKSKKSIFKV